MYKKKKFWYNQKDTSKRMGKTPVKKRKSLIMAILSFLLAFGSGCGMLKEAEDMETKIQESLVNIAYALPKGGVAAVDDRIEEALKEIIGSDAAVVDSAKEVLPPLKGTLRVAVVGQPNQGILEAAAPLLRQLGYELEIVGCEDYDSPNSLLLEGKVEANFFQHEAYLQRYNQNRDTDLRALGAVHYEPMAIYPGSCKALENLEKGARIGVPANPTGYAQALLLLQQEGLLKLMEDTDLTAVWEDVTDNPLELELVQMEEEELVSSLDELDLAIFHGGYGLWKGISPASALVREADTSLAAGLLSQLLVAEDGKEEAEELSALMTVLKSEEMKEYINRQYQGSIVVLE